VPGLITVTGSTGTIGRELVRLLAERGASVRAVYRDAGKASSLPAVERVRADLANPVELSAALTGTARLFLLTDNAPGFARIQIAVVDAAAQLGVGHLVKCRRSATIHDFVRDYRTSFVSASEAHGSA
jgi:uncharacterized protein YbjT (DUF2867 family)